MTPYYSDPHVTLYHADAADLLPQLDADIMVTDPPYGIDWPAGRLHWRKTERDQATPSITGDHDTEARDHILALWGTDRPAIMFGTWRRPRPPHTRHRLIWHKTGRHPGVAPGPIYPNDEEVYLIGDGWVRNGTPRPTVITTHEQRSKQPALLGHPTPKPLDLMHHLIDLCPPGTIIDPFAGSGSTLRAAKDLGRHSIGIELVEEYCETAALRCAQEVLPLGL